MSLLEVLSDRFVVSRNRLLSFLDLNDLLILRRVSKPFKYAAEDFIRTKKVKTSRMLFIHFDTVRPFEQYFKFQDTCSFLPQRKKLYMFDYIHGRSDSSSTSRLLQCFLSTCGATNITTLVIEATQGYIIPLHSKRWIQLLDSFPNLTYFELQNFIPFDNDGDEVTIPTSFKKLKQLKLCPTLSDNASLTASQTSFAFCVKLVEHYISNLERLHIPFEKFRDDWGVESEDVMRFACTCLFNDYNVKLENVDGDFIEELLETDGRLPEMGTIEEMEEMIDTKVVSVFCPETRTFFQELPNLEKVEFRAVEYCNMLNSKNFRPDWPQLSEVIVHFKNIRTSEYDLVVTQSLTNLWDFLFVGIIREYVDELVIEFEGFDEPNAIYPWTTDILTSCPNLSILRLGSNVRELLVLPELWNGVPHLEELYFSSCSDVIDVDFDGEDESNPVFWNLKRLKVLEFSNMECMQVTNELFINVLCHMPLKELSLSSEAEVNSITLDGMTGEGLAESVFSDLTFLTR